MFEKISQLAEAAATHVSLSRRGFMGRLGQGALGAVGVLGGVFVLSNKVQAAQKLYMCIYGVDGRGPNCGYAHCDYGFQSCGNCPPISCCVVVSKSIIGTC
jgi:hypothetical protein